MSGCSGLGCALVQDRSWITDARDSYDRVADPYADLTRGALASLPFEELLLSYFAWQVMDAGGGRVIDVGCGPGWLTGHLASLGLEMSGMDVSPAMLRVARRNNPELGFVTASITQIPIADGSVAAVFCWYVLHHVPDEDLGVVIGELARVVAPGGSLMIGAHVGDSSYLKTDGYGGLPMRVLVARRSPDSYRQLLREAGLTVDATVTLGSDNPESGAVWLAHKPA